MDSIGGYGSGDEPEETCDRSRDSNSAYLADNRHETTHSRTVVKDQYKKDRKSPDRRRKEINYTKKDSKDEGKDRTRSRNSKGDERARSYERKRDERDRDDRHRERHHRYRDRDYKNRNDKKYPEQSSSKDRHRDSTSPCDKRDKERRRYYSRSNSKEKNLTNKSTSSSDNTPVAMKYREHERLPNKTPHHLNQIVSKESSTPSATTSVPVAENRSNAPAALPSYYNPSVINPNKYAEQVQKRKLLWGNKKSEDTATKWGSAKFAQDTDGKVASKFMRLMGIKDAPKIEEPTATSTGGGGSESIKKREEMFSSMEQQYEVARQATHTMRGVGLGFSSQARPF